MKYLKKYGFLLFILLLLTLFLFSGFSFRDFWQTLMILDPLQIFVLIVASLAITFIFILGKKLLLYFMGYKTSIMNLIKIHFASLSAHYSTPAKIGYPVTVYMLNKLEKIPATVSSTVILIELFVSMALTGVIGLAGSLFYFEEKSLSFFRSGLLLMISTIIILGITWLAFKFNHRLRLLLRDMQKSLKLLKYRGFFAYVLLMLIYQASSALLLMMLGFFLEDGLSFWEALITNCSAFFIGAISMIPMGIGTRDLSMIWYLQKFGLSDPVALSVTTLSRVISTGLGYLLGILAAGLIGMNPLRHEKTDNKKNKNKQ